MTLKNVDIIDEVALNILLKNALNRVAKIFSFTVFFQISPSIQRASESRCDHVVRSLSSAIFARWTNL